MSVIGAVQDLIKLSEDALFCAAREGNTALVLSALSTTQFRKDAIGKCGKTLLMVASEAGKTDVIRKLLDLGAQVDVEAENGYTAMTYAAMAEKPAAVLLLKKHGANISHMCKENNTPLHVACMHGRVQASVLLIELGANVEAKNKKGQTPLMLAAQSGCDELVEHLLLSGANVKTTARNGQTALHEAVMVCSEKSVERLLNHGADPAVKDNAGHSALDLCTGPEHEKCKAVLQAKLEALSRAADEVAEQLIQEEMERKERIRKKNPAANSAVATKAQTEKRKQPLRKKTARQSEPVSLSDKDSSTRKTAAKRNENSLKVSIAAADLEEIDLSLSKPLQEGEGDEGSSGGNWYTVGKASEGTTGTGRSKDKRSSRKNQQQNQVQQKNSVQARGSTSSKKEVKDSAVAPVVKLDPNSGKVIPGKSYADALFEGSKDKVPVVQAEENSNGASLTQKDFPTLKTKTVARDSRTQESKDSIVVPEEEKESSTVQTEFKNEEQNGENNSDEAKKAIDVEEEIEEEEDYIEEEEGYGEVVRDDDKNEEKKPASMEDLEKRIKWLEMDARRAKSRRSRMVRMERKMRTWQMYLDANPKVSSLGLTVEHVMESMFGANGLQSLSASQICALEDLHFAALRHLSDAKVEIAKRQAILDLKSKK